MVPVIVGVESLVRVGTFRVMTAAALGRATISLVVVLETIWPEISLAVSLARLVIEACSGVLALIWASKRI